MAWSDPVDIYCERIGTGLWAEPLNALSNLGFIGAGIALLIYAQRQRLPMPFKVLALLLALIGVGSGAFHTVATKGTEVLDVLFIGLFIYSYIFYFAHYRIRANWWISLLAIPLYYGFSQLIIAQFAASDFNGSVMYFPALAGIVLMGIISGFWQSWRCAGIYFVAAGLFALALVLRSNDLANCAIHPNGSHWLWHLLNAFTLVLVWFGLRATRGIRGNQL